MEIIVSVANQKSPTSITRSSSIMFSGLIS